MNKKNIINEIKGHLADNDQIEVIPVTSNKIDITIISNCFEGKPTEEREKLILKLLSINYSSLKIGFISLYTHDEAESIGLELNNFEQQNEENERPSTWFELVNWGLHNKVAMKEETTTRTISFYSYKGGVGRTTALVHIAWILASRGKKVVMVDMDFEAPSLHQAVGNIKIYPRFGLVDYLYERVNSGYGINEDYSVNITDIIGEVTVNKGKLFIVPAGKINSDYILKIDDLRKLHVNDFRIWGDFKSEIISQIQPDLILIDSRTGINLWGALSMLQVADDSLVFMNPTPQNTEGISTILQSLYKIGIPPNIVLSPVISGDVGKERALREWDKVCTSLKNEIEYDFADEFDEPLMVPYSTEIALTDEYPSKTFIHLYNELANLLDEESEKHKLVHILSGQERWKVIHSFNFSSVDAKQEEGSSVRQVFQRTADFDRYLDQTTVLIKGKKGTGKTQLYWTTINHSVIIKELAGGRVDNVIAISGHGAANPHPIRDDFQYIQKKLYDQGGSWEGFWRAYALYRIVTSKEIAIKLPRSTQFKEIKDFFKKKPRSESSWTLQHTEFVLNLALDDNLKLLIRDVIEHISITLFEKGQITWLLYDDLDQDIPEYSQIQKDCISGLFSFVLTLENLPKRTIRTKVFLRTDIWNRLNFTNKSHFIGRDVELRWTREDFLRMALRQAKRSKEFEELIDKFSPISDINQATEELLEKALELLWGINREGGRRSKKLSRWVYERLTDANGSTFPRALIHLLQGAKNKELEYQEMQHIQAPRDRLLRVKSLNEGLINASRERCDELKQEFKDLDDIGFFSYLSQLKQITPMDPLKEWWGEAASDKFDTFLDFMEQIKSMGLASEYDKNNWKFADLYVHGFEIKRVGKM